MPSIASGLKSFRCAFSASQFSVSLPDHLLEQIGLFIGAFGRAETGDFRAPKRFQAISRKVQSLVP